MRDLQLLGDAEPPIRQTNHTRETHAPQKADPVGRASVTLLYRYMSTARVKFLTSRT